jgi:hypothetical protein
MNTDWHDGTPNELAIHHFSFSRIQIGWINGWRTTHPMPDSEVRFPNGRFGGESYTNLYLSGNGSYNLLRLSFLARHRVTLNFPKRVMYLQKRSVGSLAEGDGFFDDFYQKQGVGKAPPKPMKNILLILACSFCAQLIHGNESVRKVDFRDAPEMKELAERARRVGNDVYPRIRNLLGDGSKLHRRFDIVFRKQLVGNVAQTVGTTINLRAHWFRDNPAALDATLVHEMTHVAQQCGADGAAFHWVEGIADYVCYKFGYTNNSNVPECSASYPHYTSGYCCAGAFLFYVDKMYGSNVVRQLNTELRRGTYSDKFFAKATGKSLEKLWAEFQMTPAFTPAAAEVNRINEAIGYVNGQPPKDVAARFRAYVEQQSGGNLTLEAATFLTTLLAQNQLPGVFRRERQLGPPGRSFTIHVDLLRLKESSSDAYPAVRTLYGKKTDDPSTYHYTVVRESKESGWKLKRAWRTVSEEHVVEEYPVK